jgi:hypothetical protein
MKSNGASESHQNNNLKVLIFFAHFLESVTFFDINQNDIITNFLDTKIKSLEEDPDKKCIVEKT